MEDESEMGELVKEIKGLASGERVPGLLVQLVPEICELGNARGGEMGD